ncbi:MAG: DUF937 domain-containing protein [Acidobacteriota bacterium]|nr:MAG: DUF937 domain-containing protein [Acidobacteriota bacterium]
MNLTDLLQGALSGNTVSQISQTIGADEDATSTAIQSALPMILGGLARNSQSDEGAASLFGAIDNDHDGSVLDDLAGFIGNYGQASGAGILGHVFGGQQPAIEQTVSQTSGLDMSKVGPLLTILAPIVMGALGKTQRQEGLGAGDLAGLLGGSTQQMASGSPVVDLLSQVLDRDRDGSAVDDVIGMLGGFFGKK